MEITMIPIEKMFRDTPNSDNDFLKTFWAKKITLRLRWATRLCQKRPQSDLIISINLILNRYSFEPCF